MYTALGTMAKVTIAGAIAGGVLITGITYQGDGSVTNIKGNVNNMKNELTQAISDNDFLKGQFNSLKDIYNNAVTEANGTIEALNTKKAELEAAIAALKADLTAKTAELDALQAETSANAQAQAEAQVDTQNEINRLETELDKANAQIAELEAYVAETDSSTTYTAIDKNAYDVQAQEITDVDITPAPTENLPVSDLAWTTDSNGVVLMSDAATVKAIESGYDNRIDIIQVMSYNNGATSKLGYNIASDSQLTYIGTTAPVVVQNLRNALGYSELDFIYNGRVVMTVDINGTRKY